MSLEQKIAQLLEDARKLESMKQEQPKVEEEIVSETSIEEEEDTEQLDEISLELARRARDKAKDDAYNDGDDLRCKEDGHSYRQAVKFQKYIDKKKQKQKNEGVDMIINLDGLFEGEEYSEEFKSKVAAIFEAAVEARVKQEAEAIAEELVKHSLTENEQLKEGLVDKVDGYLDYVVEQWMQKNELALDRGIKVEIFESFIAGMKGLFESHYIAVPDEQIDLMEEVDAKAKELEAKLDEATAQNVQLSSQLKEITKQIAIKEATEGLSDLEAERFMQLAEELAYDDEESFAEKLDLIKENLVKTPKQKAIVESVVTDSPVELTEETQIDPRMQRYLRSIKG